MTESLRQHEEAADRLRDGLMLGLRELERRRRTLAPRALKNRAAESTAVRVIAAVAAVGLAGAGVALGFWLRRRNRPTARLRRNMHRRRVAMKRAWSHPELVAETSEPRLPITIGRKVALIVATAAAQQASKQLFSARRH
jgi:hypothetical protein